MAKKTAPARTKNLTAKLKKKGVATAHKKHKGDETVINQGLVDLPEGIENGVAKLVEAGAFDYKKGAKYEGESYIRIAGIVRRPIEHEGIRCKGQRTSIMIGLHETPSKTFEDQWAKVLNELRKFGIDTNDLDFGDIEETLAELEEEAPFFKFRTWKGKATKQFPNPRVNHDFQGRDDDFEDEDDPDGEVEDETENKEVEEEEEQEEEESTVSEGDEGTAPYDGEDYDVVVVSVDGDTLTVHNAEDEDDTWDVSVDEFTAADGGGDDGGDDDETGEEEENEPPEEGEPRLYDGVEVIVNKVYPRKKVADCTGVDDDEEYNGVPFDELLPAEEE